MNFSRIFFVMLFCLLGTARADLPAVDRYVLPKPKEVYPSVGAFALASDLNVEVTGAAEEVDFETARMLQEEFLAGFPKRGGGLKIKLERVSRWSGRDLGEEGYVLEVGPREIHAVALGARGLYYATQTLRQLADWKLKTVPSVRIVDWPEIRDRMVLYDFRWDNVNVEYTKRWIRELSRLKINQVMVFISGDYAFEKYPFIAGPEKWTPAKVRELKEYARRHHVQLFPQLESLGHAEGVLKHDTFKEARVTENSAYAYSPCSEKTYSLLSDLYHELTAAFDQQDLFHVGGDEVWGFDQDPRCADLIKKHGERYLYGLHMGRLRDILRGMDRRMAIWGDMLLEQPGTEIGIDRDTVIFDWDYSENKTQFTEFPSLKKFKDLGFKNIYATAAVLGFDDMYPIYPTAFQNIRGFTRAAIREGIRSVCVTMWQMQPGNNAENYLYGMAWAAHITWSPDTGDARDFNRRFASAWLGIRAPRAAAQVDRAMWFPWRVSGSSEITGKDIGGFWQIQFRAGQLLYQPFEKFSAASKDEELKTMAAESRALLRNLATARTSVKWLNERNGQNEMTIQSMRMAHAFHTYLATKTAALSSLSVKYRAARANPRVSTKVLSKAIRELEGLRGMIPALRDHLALAVEERNRHPAELERIAAESVSLEAYVSRLKAARGMVISEGRIVSAEELGLIPAPPPK